MLVKYRTDWFVMVCVITSYVSGRLRGKEKNMNPFPPFTVSNKHEEADEYDICGKKSAGGQTRGLYVGQA